MILGKPIWIAGLHELLDCVGSSVRWKIIGNPAADVRVAGAGNPHPVPSHPSLLMLRVAPGIESQVVAHGEEDDHDCAQKDP